MISREGFAILVDKPLNWTSFDVVNKLRFAFKRYYNVKKLKVGHAGTLDPLATGLLIICVGKMTKQIDKFQAEDKEYSGTMSFGAETDSGDMETKPSAFYPYEHINAEMIAEKIKEFTGEIEQVPPVYSALKQDGVPLYKLARAGEKVIVKSRKVIIRNLSMVKFETPKLDFLVKCSKGTYIRSLAVDLGRALGSGAHLTSLRRLSIGEFNVQDAWDVEEIVTAIESTNKAGRTLQ